MSESMQLTGDSKFVQRDGINISHQARRSFAAALNVGGDIDLNASYDVSSTGTVRVGEFEIRSTGLTKTADPIASIRHRQQQQQQILFLNDNSNNTLTAPPFNSNNNNNLQNYNPSPSNNADSSSFYSPSSSSSSSSSFSSASPSSSSSSSSCSSSSPMVLSELVELDTLGQGACSVVRRALHLPSCKLVALKRVSVFDKEKRKQLVKELEVLTTLNSPYLVTFHGATYQDGVTTLILEYMNRNSLSEIVRLYGPLNELMLMRVAVQAVRALALLHQNKKIHRDIKPGNLLINHAAEVKLSDFGILAALDSTSDLATTFIGTTMYMSPERIENVAYGPPSDIWSLGLTLYCLAVGQNPYHHAINEGAAGYWGLVKMIRESEAPNIPSSLPFSPYCRDFISQCVQKNPESRATAQQLLSHPWLIHGDELWRQSVERGDPNPLANRTDHDTHDIGVILNILLEKFYSTASYTRSLFELSRFQQIGISLGVDVEEVRQTFEKMYSLKFEPH